MSWNDTFNTDRSWEYEDGDMGYCFHAEEIFSEILARGSNFEQAWGCAIDQGSDEEQDRLINAFPELWEKFLKLAAQSMDLEEDDSTIIQQETNH